MRVFISYSFDDEEFVTSVHHLLGFQKKADYFLYSTERRAGSWCDQIVGELQKSDAFVVFLGKKLGETQRIEAEESLKSIKIDRFLVVTLPESEKAIQEICKYKKFQEFDPIRILNLKEEVVICAREISLRLTGDWHPWDGLPHDYPFAYEKDIISEFVENHGFLSQGRIAQGCTREWPEVACLLDDSRRVANPVDCDITSGHRDGKIIVDARSKFHAPNPGAPSCLMHHGLSFPEAGPRKWHYFPQGGALRVGILVSGGIAPGINAVINGIFERHILYEKESRKNNGGGYALEVFGYRDGFRGLLDGKKIILDPNMIATMKGEGGSVLGTSRCDRLQFTPETLEQAANQLINTDILYIIGGDGSMRASHALWTTAERMFLEEKINKKPCIVGIPKTMDNDIFWVWQSFGFLSAVQKSKEFIAQLATEARSNPRVCVVQLFGSDSGFVVTHAALASGDCDCVLIPEVPFSLAKLVAYMKEKLLKRFVKNVNQGRSPWGLIIMAETAIPSDWKDYIDNEDIGLSDHEKEAIELFGQRQRVSGQTPDQLRTGGLKMVKHVLEKEIQKLAPQQGKYWENYRVFTNEPRHLIRSMQPSTQDIIFGNRLGVLAVDNAMAGYTDFMVSQWLTEYVLVPLSLVVLGRKRVPQFGMFWKSVIASTGQGQKLDPDSSMNPQSEET